MRHNRRVWLVLGALLLVASYGAWTWKARRANRDLALAALDAQLSSANASELNKVTAARTGGHGGGYRLRNTVEREEGLLGDGHVILLRNAVIDTRRPLKWDMPGHLKAAGAPGAYLVQAAGGPMTGAGYRRLAAVGVAVVSYIPNNAVLVRGSPGQAAELAGDGLFGAVLPYEPYYKLSADLLPAAVAQAGSPVAALNVTTFPGQRAAALAALEGLGAQLMGEESTPFGPMLTVRVPPEQLTAVAQLPLAWEVEPYAPRRLLNDLTKAALGVSADTLYATPTYLNLTGSNVTVNMNDSGVDQTHPDFRGPGGVRVEGQANALSDYEGHGTHVAGIIMGNGSQSTNVTNQIPGSIIPGAGFQGKATNANLYVQSLGLVIGTTTATALQEAGVYTADATLQSNASVALGATNLISNNSWGYDGVTTYDMHAASFDQATRDAQPGRPGEQPLLFVFAAGDGGNGNDNGGGGQISSILSPGTAKNVITVGAVDTLRNITNEVTFDGLSTNQIFLPWTDSSNLVAWFSSCGNVNPGVEGLSGRFKPDVVAPGVFTISCRSSNYVDPAYATEVTPYPFVGQSVAPGQVNNYVLPLVPSNFPADTQEVIIQAVPNGQSPTPFPDLLILGAPVGQALAVLGTNVVETEGTAPLTNFVVVDKNLDGVAWNFGVKTTNGQVQPVAFDLTFYLVETNDLGVSGTNRNGYYYVISNMNSQLKPSYVYQYGTSMAAGAVSGMLALMQEFVQGRLGLTNAAPALYKAMLLNGARSLNQQYDFNTQLAGGQPPSGPNEQGWGLPFLPNSLPGSLTNSSRASMLLVNQAASNALATGQWESYQINCGDGNATNFPLRFTLVWTDPPGNPAAGVALVNNLDLVVTSGSGTNAQLWLGNDFQSGDIYTTNNSGDGPDFINNVQNVYIDNTNAPFQFPVTVTVLGGRVNVNAVTTQTNQIAQDYALVISSDDPALSQGLTITPSGVASGPLTLLAPYVGRTNTLGAPLLNWPLTGFVQGSSNLVTVASNAVPLLDQRVGANQPGLYAHGGLYQGTDTNGNPAQWHFFVYTNNQFSPTNDATNVAFATFLPPNLATQIEPRTNGADIDLYVSTNPGLTNLDPAVFAAMKPEDMSLGRSGTETVIYSNSVANEVYYIGVKSEDQQGADFGFYAIAQQAPFNVENPDGSITYTYAGPPVVIPDDQFGAPPAHVIAIAGKATQGRSIRKVTVSLTIDHANPSELYGILQPDQTVQVVLNNYTGPEVSELYTNLYNDLDDGFPGVHSDGPGTLQNFMTQTIPPLWMLQEADNTALQGGVITGFSVTVWPQPLLGPIAVTLAPGQVFFDYVDVPSDAIYLTNSVILENGTGNAALGVYMTNENDVTQSDLDGTNLIFNAGQGLSTPGGYLLVTTNSPLPLSGGLWYYGIYNNGTTTVTFTNEIFFGYNLVPNLVQTYTNSVPLALTTDGTTNSAQICVASGQQVLDVSVGLRLQDPDLDDLEIQLTSPQGSTIVLFENRGGTEADSLGLTLTNSAATNLIYTTFTEDTNLATEPIKFAPPPYATNIQLPLLVLGSNSFEYFSNNLGVFHAGAGTYTNGQLVDGWLLETNLVTVRSVVTNVGTNQVTNSVTNQVFNEVSVVTDPNQAVTGSNYLALASGRIAQTFATIPGASYEFRYYARSPGLTDWWPGDNNVVDLVGTNTGVASKMTYDVGEVARAFTFSGNDGVVTFGTNTGNFGTNDFTIDFWIKTTAKPAINEPLVIKEPECDAVFNVLAILLNSDGTIKVRVYGAGDTDDATFYSAAIVNDGIYHEVALQRKGLTFGLFVDGVLSTAFTTTGIADVQNNAPLEIGNSVCIGVNGGTYFTGDLDELDLWDRALSPAEIAAIYQAGSSGKYSTNSLYPNFRLAIDAISTNTVLIHNFEATNWIAYTNSFIATSNQTTIELDGNPLGVLLDDLQLVQLPYTNFNNYYLPEEPLTPLLGQNPQGCWTLGIWDTRLDAPVPTNGLLLGWTLQLTTSSTNVNLILLTNRVPYVAPGPVSGITYFGVDVPATANFATNILFNASGPMNLYFNQNALPTGGLPGDVTLVQLPQGGLYAGTNTLTTQGTPPPLVPGQRYFLGVQNTGGGPETFSLQVNFDVNNSTNIIALTNSVALTTNLATNGPAFYSFLVPTNAIMVTFQLLNPSNGQANLYAREGLPVPAPLSFDYQSLNQGTNDQFIVVTTNSDPVPLIFVNTNEVLPQQPKTWYLSVYNPGTNVVGYTVVATYVTPETLLIRNLNNFPNFTYRDLKPAIPPGFPTNVMYSFTVTNTNAVAVQFTVTNLSAQGQLQLLVNDDTFPTPEDFYIGSFNPGSSTQFVSIVTNTALLSLSNIWYAAVPNVSTNNTDIRYSITATVLTNGPVTATPLFLGASIASAQSGFTMYWSAQAGSTYQIQVSTNLSTWTVTSTITAQSNTAAYTDSTPVLTQPLRFFRIVTQ